MGNKKIDMTTLANYVRIRTPDKDKLAELVIRAKGAKRSMRQFALDCGVNPSTLSRIVNKKTVGTNSDELIMAIAENADAESGITFEMLMDAHGKVIRQMSGKIRRETGSIMENAVKDIIFNELLKRGYALAEPQNGCSHGALNYHYRTDWAILTDAVSTEGKMEKWEFEIWPAFTGSEHEIKLSAMKLRQKLLMVLGLYYTGDMSPKKMTFVLTNANLYDFLVSTLEGLEFADSFSLILVDLEKASVEQEFVFPIKGCPDIPCVFFPIEEAAEEPEEQVEVDDDYELGLDDIIFDDSDNDGRVLNEE